MTNTLPTYRELVKNLKKEKTDLPTVQAALLADSASQFLVKALKGYGVEKGLNLELWEADYNQIDLQIADPGSAYHVSVHDYTLIYKSSPKLLLKYYKQEDKASFAEVIIQDFRSQVESINAQRTERILLFNFEEIPDQVFNNYANKHKESWIYQLRKINFGLMDLAQEFENVFICDLHSIQSRIGRGTFYDPVNHVRSDVNISLKALPEVARSIVDIISASAGKINKCLILDLDNTTWGGIIGDDGIEKIQIGDLGIGKAFTELQYWAKNLKERGIILCICSKNTDSVAREPFVKHPDMVLRLEDIAVFVANWESKADNIRHIQSILNIGFDSMVFLDDNPFERNLIRTEIPEVTVPELPEDPVHYMSYLQQLNLFETASVSGADKKRTQQYQSEAKRVTFQKSQNSLESFLSNLEMQAEIKAFEDFYVPRIAQLTQRSNQFNLRTIRYTEQEVRKLMSSELHITRYVTLKDKFGEHGLISLLILEKKDSETAFIDTWIMSCRVLKRDVEKFALADVVETCSAAGIKRIVGERIPTKKNVLVKDHYKNLGFVEKENGKWELETGSFQAQDHHISKVS